MYNELARLIFDISADERSKFGMTGYEDDDGEYAIRVPDEPNNIYVRLEDGDREVKIEAININVPIQPDYPVLVYYRNKQAYAIPDPERALDYRGTNEALSTVAPHSHEPGQGNYDVVSTIRMREGQLSLSDPYSMVVDISAFKYWDTDGHEQWFTGGSIDLTDYVPVTTEMQVMCKVAFNRTDGELAAFIGEERSITFPLTEADLAEIVIGHQYKPLAGVRLSEGLTIIDDMKYIVDWRFWIADFAEAATGVTGTGSSGGVEILADLGDVSSASQTANFILAAGDGSTSGDYRGRLLVEDDIPALSASKITSGVFDDARIPNLNASKITTGALDMERGGLGVDASNLDGYIVTDGASSSSIKYNVTGSAPTVTDDANAGYTVGSQWIDDANDEEFVCVDNTVGAAIWKSTTSTGTSTSTFHGVRETLSLSLSGASETPVGFTGADYDTDTFSDGIDSLTVPSSFGGFYQATANVYFSDISGVPQSGTILVRIKKNGSTIDALVFRHDFLLELDKAVSLTVQTTGDPSDTFIVTVINNVGDDFDVSGHFMLNFLGDV